MEFDFAGWATKNDLLCDDGRTIRKNAFKDNDGQQVPLVWNHGHQDPTNVLGHAILENRKDGVYAYCKFNNTEKAQHIKEAVKNGDLNGLSIYANKLVQKAGDVLHGAIREVSIVLARANPGATIDTVLAHGSDMLDGYGFTFDENNCAIITTGEEIKLSPSIFDNDKGDDMRRRYLQHAEEGGQPVQAQGGNEDSDETVEDVFNTLTDKQKDVVYFMLGQVAGGDEEDDEDSDEEEEEMKHNVFEGDNSQTLVHGGIDFMDLRSDAKRIGSWKEAYMQHAEALGYDPEEAIMHGTIVDPHTVTTYGIMPKVGDPDSLGIEALFPEYQNLNSPPDWIKRDTDWVSGVMSGVHHTPFSRIKSMFADITEDDARARGYMKGNYKKEEVFSLLKRTTDPQTVYKKQRIDRDDIIDITDFNVVEWIKAEMRMMLDEEIARAILIGDGRLNSSDDKIKQDHVRAIYLDDDFYSNKVAVKVSANADEDEIAKKTIRAIIKARKDYKGSGSPTFFTTTDVITDMLLLEDANGRIIYDSEEKLRTALRVSKIVEVEVMENQTRTDSNNVTRPLIGIIVNLSDYNVGADKGGAVSTFEDFDIDYNQNKYLIETRLSGALIKPHSAMVIELEKASGQGAQG